jgi:hypothetical protein
MTIEAIFPFVLISDILKISSKEALLKNAT